MSPWSYISRSIIKAFLFIEKNILKCFYLDCYLSIDNGKLTSSLYDKRGDFNFPIVNFPFLSSNIPSAPAYGVYVSHLIRYARACSNYQVYMERGKVLTTKLLSQGYEKTKLVATLKKFYGRHHDLVNPSGWQFAELFLMFCQWRAISRFLKSRAYASTYISSFRPMGMVGEACLLSNAYYLRTPDYTLNSGVHVCWSEHSFGSHLVQWRETIQTNYQYPFDGRLVTITQAISEKKSFKYYIFIHVYSLGQGQITFRGKHFDCNVKL